MTRLLWLYPRRWRRRFGLEVEELLAASSRPVRDRLDLLVALAMVLGAGVALTAVAVTQLENGVAELGQHWWSGAPALLVVVSAGGLVVARRAS